MPTMIDLSGLPPQAVSAMESLVGLLREKHKATSTQHEMSDAEFESTLDELAAGPAKPQLPANFSRADIYGDHD